MLQERMTETVRGDILSNKYTEGTNWIKSHLAKIQTSTAFAYIVCCFIITWKLRLSYSRSFKKSFRNPTRVKSSWGRSPIDTQGTYLVSLQIYSGSEPFPKVALNSYSNFLNVGGSMNQPLAKHCQKLKTMNEGSVVLLLFMLQLGFPVKPISCTAFMEMRLLIFFCHKLHWCEKTWFFSGWWCILRWVHREHLLLCHGARKTLFWPSSNSVKKVKSKIFHLKKTLERVIVDLLF